ncbi:MAG: ABC transporter [Gemmatimonadetes bacterium]|nr:ABC transporter [Gemmatimonadota bacterium]
MARSWMSRSAAVLGAVWLAACSDTPITSPDTPELRRGAFDLSTAQVCGTVTTVEFELMNPSSTIGTVSAWNDATDLVVAFSADLASEWRLRESFVWAGADASGIPLTPGGTPRVVGFPYKTAHNPTVVTYQYTIPLAAVGGVPGQDLAIAAIALLARGTHRGVAWGDGADINPPAPHEYFEHQVQRCGSPPPPPPGKDIVVFNDINVFDANAMSNPNNVKLVQNLVNFTTSGPRGANTQIVWDRGRVATCGPLGNDECNDSNMGTTRSTISGAGFTMVDIASNGDDLDDLIAASGANWKEIWLWTPNVAFTVDEVNALKQFADEGGRVVFIGEWQGYYPPSGIALENQFLLDMGAVMTNTGGAVDCGYNTVAPTSLRAHQITSGLTDLTMACSSVLIPGPNDFPLYLDLTNTKVLSAVATIDITPISTTGRRMAAPLTPWTALGLNVSKASGK